MSTSSSTRFGNSAVRQRRSSTEKDKTTTTPGLIRELLPKKGYLHCEDTLTFVLCKPKLLPLKSYTMENLTRIQQESIEKAKQEMNATNLD